jgi:hypothetical protein
VAFGNQLPSDTIGDGAADGGGPRHHHGRQAERLRMTWARHASPTLEQGRFAEARASEKMHYAVQNRKAAHTVASHASDAQDCANLLAMLGLDTLDENGAIRTPSVD